MKVRKILARLVSFIGIFGGLIACSAHDADWINFIQCLCWEVPFLAVSLLGIFWLNALESVEEERKNRYKK